MITKRTLIKTAAYPLVTSLLGRSSLLANPGGRLKNPLIDTPGMADPHILVERDACYLFTGHDVGFGVNDWVMPRWRIYRSTDLRYWREVGAIEPKDNYMGKDSVDCWAGDIVKRNGMYYWFFSDRDRSLGVMSAPRPEGPYKDVLGKPLLNSFDPTVFVDDDNTPYIVCGKGTYYIARLKDSLVELGEEVRPVVIEGPEKFPKIDKNYLHKHNGIYYLSASGYYATSRTVYGPYKARGLVGRGWGLDTGYAHGAFFEWKRNWYHVWCRYRDRSKDRVRDCFIAPATYNDEGLLQDDLSDLPEPYRWSGAPQSWNGA